MTPGERQRFLDPPSRKRKRRSFVPKDRRSRFRFGKGVAEVGDMSKGRMEAFSDGVLAILITIMVLELKTPSGTDLDALWPLAPVFLSYALSFVFLGIYWNNHHHL